MKALIFKFIDKKKWLYFIDYSYVCSISENSSYRCNNKNVRLIGIHTFLSSILANQQQILDIHEKYEDKE
jgi:hypothetical protein